MSEIYSKGAINKRYLRPRYRIIRTCFPGKQDNEMTSCPKGMTETFHDFFKDLSNWDAKSSGGGPFHPDHPDHYYIEPEIDAGGARFVSKYMPKTVYYTQDGLEQTALSKIAAAHIISKDHFTQRYGLFEAYHTIPTSTCGAWCCPLWLYGSNKPWALANNQPQKNIEIDANEFVIKQRGKHANRAKMNLHFHEGDKHGKLNSQLIYMDSDISTIHKTQIYWHPEYIEVFFDEIEVFRYTDKAVLDYYFNAPGSRMWMISGMGVDPNYLTADGFLHYRASYFMQAVRVFQYNEFLNS